MDSKEQKGVEKQSGWKFSEAFWTANIVELFERAAYYAVFIAITLYTDGRVVNLFK